MNKLRKIGFLVLALVSALFVLVGCGKESGPTAAEAAARISTTVDKTTVTKDFVVNNSIVLEGVTFTVTWESNNKVATIGTTKVDSKGDAKENGGFYLVNIDYENNTADQNVTLTATVANGKDTATKSISFTVPKFATMTYAEFAAADDDTSVTVDGIVTGIISKDSKGNSTNALYVNALDSTGGFYVYGLEKNPVTEGIKEGMTVRVSGLKDTYSGTLEIVSASVKVTDETIKTVTPVDLTEAFVAAENLAADTLTKQALLVTLKGVIIGDQDQSNGYYYFTLGGKKAYLRISSSVCPVVTADTATIKNGHSEHTGWIANVTGVVCVYSGNFYLTPVSANCFEYISLPELSDAEQVATEKEALTIANTKYAANAEVELPLTGSAYKGVTISWASDNEAVAIDATTGKATITLGKSAVNVKLTATLTKGTETATKEFTLELASASGIEIVDPVNGQEFYFGLYQANLGKYLFFTGVPKDGQTFYQTTTEKLSESVKIKVTAVEGGYTLSFVEGGVTKYITMSITSDNKTSLDIKTNAADAGVFTYDAEHQTFIQTINDSKLFMGANNSYNTIAASWHKYLETNFPVHLYAVSDGYEEPSEPTEEPTYTEMTAAQALAATANTLVKVTGTVVAESAKGYLVKDSSGIILVYINSGYDKSLEIGDTVTVEGKVSAYSGANQIVPENVTKGTAVSVTQPTATDITATADAFHEANKTTPTITYVKLTAKYTTASDGKYHNLTIEGAETAKGSLLLPAEDYSSLVGKDVVVEGYFIYVSGTVYLNIIAVNMTEATAHVHAPATDWTKDETHHWHTCSGCSELVDKAEHTWTEGAVQTQPTETTEGLRVDTCACGATKNVVLPTLSHTHAAGSTWVSNDEKHWKECACGQDATKYEEADHVWNEGVTTEATALAAGKTVYTCTVCEKTKEVAIPQLVSTVAAFLAAKNETTPMVLQGYITAVNKVGTSGAFILTDAAGTSVFCYAGLNVALGDEVIISGKYGANNGFDQIASPALIKTVSTGNNVAEKSGTVNNVNVTDVAALLNTADVQNADLYAAYGAKYLSLKGYVVPVASGTSTYYYLAVTQGGTGVISLYCNTGLNVSSYSGQEVTVLGFARGSSVSNKYLTIQVQAIVVHEHEASSDWSKDAEYHWHACSGCAELLDKAAHEWGEGEVTTQPTEDADGEKTYTCTCGQTKTEVVPALGHTHTQTTTYAYDETNHWFVCACGDAETKFEEEAHEWVAGEVVAPTYTTTGYTNYSCVCGETKTGDETSKLEFPTTEFDVKTFAEASTIATTAGANYSSEKYYIEGVIKSVYNTQYGNMYIQDANGTEFLVYGVYSFNGATRYDAMTTKPVVGEYIVVYGVLGTYNDNPQMKNGWLVQHKTNDFSLEKLTYDKELINSEYTLNVGTEELALPTLKYSNAEWNITEGTAVEISDGKIVVISRPSEGEENAVVKLTVTVTLGDLTDDIEVVITIKAPVAGGNEEINANYDLVANFSKYGGSNWNSTYEQKTINSDKLGTDLPAATIVLSNANKQSSTITDRPVLASKGSNQYVTFTLTESGKEIQDITFEYLKWGSKTFNKIVIEYKDSTGAWVECSASITDPASGSLTINKELPAGVTEVRLSVYKSGSSNVQLGISGIKVTIA